MKTVQRQRGMSTLTLLVVIALIGLAITCGLKMVPAYIDYWVLKGIFDSVEEEPGFAQLTPAQVQSQLRKRLDINSVRGFDWADAVSIRREEGKLIVEFYYEVREELLGNVDVVMKFKHNYEANAG